MAFDFDKPGELERVNTLFEHGTWQEMLRLCHRFDAWNYARELGLKPDRSEPILVRKLKAYIDTGQHKQPPKCDCELPDGLRWLDGEASYFYDNTGQPDGLGFDPAEQIDKAARAWMSVCGIKLTKARNRREADIVVSWSDIDGIGRTLGMTYQPASGEDMSACGGPCGDVLMDWAEGWSERFFFGVFLHELGHAIGIPHTPTSLGVGNNIMEAFFNNTTVLGPWDIRQAITRYGKAPEVSLS